MENKKRDEETIIEEELTRVTREHIISVMRMLGEYELSKTIVKQKGQLWELQNKSDGKRIGTFPNIEACAEYVFDHESAEEEMVYQPRQFN